MATNSSRNALESALFDSFGFSEFRSGQREVVEAVLKGKDALVLWATGRGKSLCYQLPPMHTGATAVIVSPLISLMHDQVTKLNATVGEGRKVVAVLLGSAQVDPSIEGKALNGEFRFVFVSPEKMVKRGFLEKLLGLHYTNGLALVAIDEAHCISEWGHQFRKEYQQLGAIREALGQAVPILALTATAVDAVRNDIVKTLGLVDPFTSISTVDRPNLSLKVNLLPSGGTKSIHTNLEPVVDAIRTTRGSTIIYASTRAKVKMLVDVLRGKLAPSGILVLAYPSGDMTPGDRADVHQRFMDNRCLCVVATIAFGMGIDKPDIRRIVHYGSCKTFEEYYQQIGRAGRDGMPAECIMICSDQDFTNFHSTFYLEGLSPTAKKAIKLVRPPAGVRSRQFILQEGIDNEVLWRGFYYSTLWHLRQLLRTCKARKDRTRDFSRVARVVLLAVKAGGGVLGKSGIRKVINGNYKPKSGVVSFQLQNAIDEIARCRSAGKRRSLDFYEGILSSLAAEKYVVRSFQSFKTGTRDITYESFELTQLGANAVVDSSKKVILPVPPLIRKEERELEEKVQLQKDKLVKAGVSLCSVPTEELNNGSGPVIEAHLHWIRTLESYRKRGAAKRAEANEELLRRIEGWRDLKAQKLRMAPAAVIPPDMARRIAYSKPTEPTALRAIGLRIADSDSLLRIIASWLKEFDCSKVETGSKRNESSEDEMLICFPAKCQGVRRPLFVYKKSNKWEMSWERFQAGENHQTIAMDPGQRKNRRPLATSTIFGHLMKAVEYGLK